MGSKREAIVVCSDKSMSAGITIWDAGTGDRLLHIPTCASRPHGLLCLNNRFIVASQVHKHGSLGGGSVFTWPLSKPQAQVRSYPMEAIGPISCSNDGVFLAGGSPSGNVYIWEVASGRLLKSWHARNKSLSCMVFSDDDSFLFAGSDDGVICIWSLLSLLDIADSGSSPPLFHSLWEHCSSITDLTCTSGSLSSIFVSSSLDGTCKVWDFFSGMLLQTQAYPVSITSVALDPEQQLFFSGSKDGSIFVNMLNIGLLEETSIVSEDQQIVLNGHNGPITVLTFCDLGLISASEDCTVCIWDVVNRVITRRFNHQKGPVTNLVVIPQSSLYSSTNHQKASSQFRISSLDKFPRQDDKSKGAVCCSLKDNPNTIDFINTDMECQQIVELEKGQSLAVLQLEVEASVENRVWATKMSKHVMDMNKHLQTRILDLMDLRLQVPSEKKTRKKKTNPKVEVSLSQGGKQTKSAD